MSARAKACPEIDADYLLSAPAVRERCGLVLTAAERGETRHFRLVSERLKHAAARVVAITRRRYPTLDVPYHSRWRHFGVGGVDRGSLVAPGASPLEASRAGIDLATVSVLLDAGAGSEWRYREADTAQILARSEGLAVASLHAMQTGLFSADAANPWRADAEALQRLTDEQLAGVMQHRSGNALVGIAGRADLLRRLGQTIAAVPDIFGAPARLGNLLDHWLAHRYNLPAPEILHLLLRAFGPIWPSRIDWCGTPLGDCGYHPAIPGDGIVPFHKLSQWLAYSLVEPLEAAGIRVTDLDGLTGLSEYRNGGLFVDCGVLEPLDPDLLHRPLDPASEPVVEWRALTIALLDRLAVVVRQHLGKSADEFPLAKMLEGGTWAAGREIASELRLDGGPPLTIVSDGTLF